MNDPLEGNGFKQNLIMSKFDDLSKQIVDTRTELRQDIQQLRDQSSNEFHVIRKEIEFVKETAWSTKIKIAGFSGGIVVIAWIISAFL